jgi:ubiquinone/menaquinone biosynthesis C-methylase UbiE
MNGLNGNVEPGWQYNETKPCGVNYNDAWRARVYDRRQQGFRDYKAESKGIIAILGLDKSQKVIDMGCGTGAFAINAAKHLKKVYAVDVSNAMLRCARKKARKAKLGNIEFSKGGFLTYTHNAEFVDAIVSVTALHHLPDFWKMIGLQRLTQMVKTDGKLYIKDVVFSFDLTRYKSHIKTFIQIMIDRTEPGMKWDLETHFRQEYSTCGWIMEGLLERAGFRIDNADYKDDFFAMYLCTKKG